MRCKWPNDLMAGDDKVGGILAESLVEGDRLVSVVIGSGINLVAPEGLDGAAGVGADVDSTDLLGAFLAAFSDGYRPEASGFAADVIARWTDARRRWDVRWRRSMPPAFASRASRWGSTPTEA